MPWHLLGSPSIQLGALHALLQRGGLECRSHSLYLEFLRFLVEHGPRKHGLGIDEYGEICSRWMNVGAGEWIFGVPEIRKGSLERDERFAELCRANGMSKELLGKLRRVRELVPAFLERCASEILASEPAVVGFSAVYSQMLPSIALAHTLKARAPGLKIVLGGASCEGPMGPALLRAFDDVDVVVRGEAEGVLCELVQSLLAGAPIPSLSGLCFREGDAIIEVPVTEGPRVAMNEVPVPIFDEYFERLARNELAHQILPQLPFETARGCWWGMKAHCTFCGLNGMEMAFRSKSPERVIEEVATLAQRYGVLDFTCTDNILDMKYFRSLLPRLAESGHDFGFFFETKANLDARQVDALRDAGVRAIQPGIESLSTPILKSMRKGVTALQNIRLLKWCARDGIRVIWNLLHGFPGESPEEYERMAELVPSLVHLDPPTLGPLMVYRFSPYHSRPQEHGIELGRPLPYYGLLYDVDDDCLRALAQAFEFTYSDGRDPDSYVGLLRKRVEQWNRDWHRNQGALSYRRGPDFMVIFDSRTTAAATARYTLGEEEALVYLACDAGASPDAIARELRSQTGSSPSDSRLRELLRDFIDARLMYEENGRYLSLAVESTGPGLVLRPTARSGMAVPPSILPVHHRRLTASRDKNARRCDCRLLGPPRRFLACARTCARSADLLAEAGDAEGQDRDAAQGAASDARREVGEVGAAQDDAAQDLDEVGDGLTRRLQDSGGEGVLLVGGLDADRVARSQSRRIAGSPGRRQCFRGIAFGGRHVERPGGRLDGRAAPGRLRPAAALAPRFS